MKRLTLLLLVSTLTLAACATSAPNPASPQTPIGPAPVTEASAAPAAESADLLRVDSQGAVTVEITPLNLTSPGETLDFSVSMDTHSVDLSMDLAALSTLMTDRGDVVQAVKWDAPLGGHHVAGTLSFPAALNGRPLLAGVSQITIYIKNVDAATRMFTWDLPQ